LELVLEYILPMTSNTRGLSTSFHAIFRAVTGFLILGSVIWQVTDRLSHGVFRGSEYFAYVTVQSSLLAGFVCLIGAWRLWNMQAESIRFGLARLSVTGYAVIVGVVYNALLRGVPGDVRDAGYDWPVLPNEILHVWGPIFVFLDWLLSREGSKISFKSFLWVLAYPVVWISFTVVRGYSTGWWPYPFLDPTQPAGVGGMVTYIVVIVVFLAVTCLVALSTVKALYRNRATA
jgi:hypothetical protein